MRVIASLAEGEQRREPVRRRPRGVACIDQQLAVTRHGGELLHHLLERVIVQRRGDCDDARHERLSSPRR